MAASSFLLILKLTDIPRTSLNRKDSAVIQDFIICIHTTKNNNVVLTEWEDTKSTPGLGSGACSLNLWPTSSFYIEAVQVIQIVKILITLKND